MVTPQQIRSSHTWKTLATRFKNWCHTRNLPCHLCHQPIDYTARAGTESAFDTDHIKPLATHPQLAYVRANLAPSHASCNRSRGATVVTEGTWTPANW